MGEIIWMSSSGYLNTHFDEIYENDKEYNISNNIRTLSPFLTGKLTKILVVSGN